MNKNQKRALKEFLNPENKTIEQIAKASGLSVRTIYSYKVNTEFQAELKSRQATVIDQVLAGLTEIAGDAVDGFKTVLDDPNIEGAVNLRMAAKDVLTLIEKYHTSGSSLTAIEKRIDLDKLSYEQIRRLADGESVLEVLAG